MLVLASGVTQILALGNAKIYQHVGISIRKILASGALPNANPRRQVFCVAVEYRLKAMLLKCINNVDFCCYIICYSV